MVQVAVEVVILMDTRDEKNKRTSQKVSTGAKVGSRVSPAYIAFRIITPTLFRDFHSINYFYARVSFFLISVVNFDVLKWNYKITYPYTFNTKSLLRDMSISLVEINVTYETFS